ncbi:MAG: SAM-dependent methyltransferase, partial [Oscillospiraceae bacterium]
MWVSDKWKDYELIDCSSGQKLERWGEQILVRPDPQAIWETKRTNKGWDRPSAKYSRNHEGGGQWEKNNVPESWQIKYDELTFNVKPMNFKH